MQLSCDHGLADFGDECPALAAVRQQQAGLVLIAARLELDDLDIQIWRSRRETACDFLGLRERHRTFARPDTHGNCCHVCSVTWARFSSENRALSGGNIRRAVPPMQTH